MPNGGSDCCGTCWFNSVNDGRAGYNQNRPKGGDRCVIRDNLLVEDDPFWTYCANHPHHNPDRVAIPVGPVYRCENDCSRYPWVTSPDTEAIRSGLLELLDNLPEVPEHREYPSGTQFDVEVIRQLGFFRERQALPGLRRVLKFKPDSHGSLHNGHKGELSLGGLTAYDRRSVIGAAYEALGLILGDEASPELEAGLTFGRGGGQRNDRDVIVRWGAARGLRRCSPAAARRLIEAAVPDPDENLTRFLGRLLGSFPS
jgi:hypothetical protein